MSCTKSFMTVVVGLFLAFSAHASGESFPVGPDLNLTPGSLCDHPDALRYPEKVPYCNRNVDSRLKAQIFQDYIQKLGYNIDMKKRSQFKIDHLIPLCVGGSNHKDNLWPQHSTVYERTDALEATACEKMAAGHLTQRHAIDLILMAKHDLSKVNDVMKELRAL